jgi:hypothetical protein
MTRKERILRTINHEELDRIPPGAHSDPVTIYTNTTGRNDFHIMKVTHEINFIFFQSNNF